MSKFFSANQYEDAFRPQRLQNWELPSVFQERPRKQEGFTQVISNDRGHLLDGIKRTKENPWGDFVGTWDLPKKIPGNCVTNTTSRRFDCHDSLMRDRKNAHVKLLGDEKNQIRTKHVKERKAWVEQGKGRPRRRQGVQARTRTPTLKYMPSSERLPPLHQRDPEDRGLPSIPCSTPKSPRKSAGCRCKSPRSPAIKSRSPGSRGKSPGKCKKGTLDIPTPPYFTPGNTPHLARSPRRSPNTVHRRTPKKDEGVSNINKNNINENANPSERQSHASSAQNSHKTSPAGDAEKIAEAFVETPVDKLFELGPSPKLREAGDSGSSSDKASPMGLEEVACSHSTTNLLNKDYTPRPDGCSQQACVKRGSPTVVATLSPASNKSAESAGKSPKESGRNTSVQPSPQQLAPPEQQIAYHISPFPPTTPENARCGADVCAGKLIC